MDIRKRITDDHNTLLLDGGRILHSGPGVRALDLETVEIAWHGLAFMDGFAAGAPSIREFWRRSRQDLGRAAASLKGIYFLLMRDKTSGTCMAFVDNSGLYHAYWSSNRAGTRFFQLASLEGLGPADVDPESLVEFLHFGCVYSGKTFFPHIRTIGPDFVLCTSQDGGFTRLLKNAADISAAREQSFESMLSSFCSSVPGESISLDLTGGIDSRLLAVVLDYFGLRFEVAASGIPGNRELLIAEAVAESLGHSFHVTHHDCDLTDWNWVCAVCDGMFDPTKASRPMQLHGDRARRGVSLAISGAGGELFKDFWWLQDFPFYLRRSPNLTRLYDLRIAGSQLQHSYLSQPYRSLSETCRERMLRSLWQFSDASNTRTYDRVYYSFKMGAVAGRSIKNALACLQVYTPYLERDAVSIGYNLSRWMRFFNQYHRRTISRYSPRAARIPTTEGHMSASSGLSMIARDLPKFVVDRWKRLQRKTGPEASRLAVEESPNDPKMAQAVYRTLEERRSIERLKEARILSASLQLENVQKGYLGPLLALDWFLEEIKANRTVPVSEAGKG